MAPASWSPRQWFGIRPKGVVSATALTGIDATPVGEADLIDLICRFSLGNREAFACFYDSTCAMVYGMASSVIHDDALAAMVAENIYLNAWVDGSTFDVLRDTPTAWLASLASHEITRQAGTLGTSGDLRPHAGG